MSYRSVELSEPVEFHCGDWQISTDKCTFWKLRDLRLRALPDETGGVLLGYPDHHHRMLYVVDALPSPPDSEEWPTSYIRGCAGLKEAVGEVTSRTAGTVEYLGEWHSHPDESECEPISADLVFLAWLTDHRFRDGMPALMAIVCEGDDVVWRTATRNSSENPDDR